MARSLVGRILPPPVKRGIRRGASWAARVRNTRAWPAVRPAVRLARRVVNVDLLLGREPGANEPQRAATQIELLRRRMLNLGLTDPALAELRGFAGDDTYPYRQRFAAFELALWHADRYTPADAEQALSYLKLAARGEADATRRRRIAVLEAECLAAAGDPVAARRAVIEPLAARTDPDLCLVAANLAPQLADRLAWFNRALRFFGLAEVALVSDDRTGGGSEAGLREAFDRLVAAEPDGRAAGDSPEDPLVTVIMPVYNSAATVMTALASVRAQTWQRWELLVVDDASTDRTAELVAACAADDPRVRLIRASVNRGTYVARNLALTQARGEFVTCHDADDWSHPEKLERQVRALRAAPAVVANLSQQVRATSDLQFHRRGKPGYFGFANLSSLMFRRAAVTEQLGYWDSVRFGADAEFQRRLKRAFGEQAVVELATGPLCLQRQSADSLTGNAAFGYHGFFMGARKDYFEAYTYYHRRAESLRYEFPQPRRPFPVPAPMLPEQPAAKLRERSHFDVIIASDFRLVGGSTISSLEEVKAQSQLGLRTGLVQMSFYDADPRRSVAPRVRDLLDGEQVRMLVHGEQVSCDLLIVRYPPVLQEPHRFLPEITPEQLRVIVNQPPMSDYGPAGVRRYRIPDCHRQLLRYFGKPGVWHPIGPLVRQALHQHHAGELAEIELSSEDWVNIIDVAGWQRPARPTPGPRPRIGRHSRDNPLKWPETASDLLATYPDSPEYEVHVLGGGSVPKALLGYLPDNWRVYEFGQLSPADFLAGIDVFVYYPNRHWVESFGRVILEAMAVGVPVVLPEQFRPLFADAAIYAAPAEVRAWVDRLVADPDYYAARVDAGQQFVEKGFGYARHAERIGGLRRR